MGVRRGAEGAPPSRSPAGWPGRRCASILGARAARAAPGWLTRVQIVSRQRSRVSDLDAQVIGLPTMYCCQDLGPAAPDSLPRAARSRAGGALPPAARRRAHSFAVQRCLHTSGARRAQTWGERRREAPGWGAAGAAPDDYADAMPRRRCVFVVAQPVDDVDVVDARWPRRRSHRRAARHPLLQHGLEAILDGGATLEKCRRLGFGNETMSVLAPLFLFPLARAAAPPPRSTWLRALMFAAAAAGVVLTTASVALAFS